MQTFPIGGPRQPVYDFMRDHGFMPSAHSDKVWVRPGDGVVGCIYGSGSKLQLSRDGELIADAPIVEAMGALK